MGLKVFPYLNSILKNVSCPKWCKVKQHQLYGQPNIAHQMGGFIQMIGRRANPPKLEKNGARHLKADFQKHILPGPSLDAARTLSRWCHNADPTRLTIKLSSFVSSVSIARSSSICAAISRVVRGLRAWRRIISTKRLIWPQLACSSGGPELLGSDRLCLDIRPGPRQLLASWP